LIETDYVMCDECGGQVCDECTWKVAYGNDVVLCEECSDDYDCVARDTSHKRLNHTHCPITC